MPTRIKMSNKKTRAIEISWPILNGSVSKAFAKCGQENCRCSTDENAMHGPYYRWIGNINGKKTTKTITKKTADECRGQIKNYEQLQKLIAQLLEEAIDSAPWTHSVD